MWWNGCTSDRTDGVRSFPRRTKYRQKRHRVDNAHPSDLLQIKEVFVASDEKFRAGTHCLRHQEVITRIS